MPTTDESFLDGVIVRAPLSVLLRMSEEQRERVEFLARGWNPVTVVLCSDLFNKESVLFTLYNAQTTHLLSGLIELDGSSHT